MSSAPEGPAALTEPLDGQNQPSQEEGRQIFRNLFKKSLKPLLGMSVQPLKMMMDYRVKPDRWESFPGLEKTSVIY